MVISSIGIGGISHLDLGVSSGIGGFLSLGIGGISNPRIELKLFTWCKKGRVWLPISGGAGSVG